MSFMAPAAAAVMLSSEAATAGAMKDMGPNTDFRVSITNPEGDAAYPVASFTWFLLHKQYEDAAKAGALVKFAWWAETQGQSRAAPLGYAPLPKRSEEHTSELQSQSNLVCRLLLEKKKQVH